MSLRVNLILPDEKRSGSRFNTKAFIRVGKIVIPLIIAVIIGKIVLDMKTLSSDLQLVEAQWKACEPKQLRARELVAQLDINSGIKDELMDWQSARIDWHKQLQTIAESTPELVQLTSLVISQDIINDTPPSPPKRQFKLAINGKTSGEGAMDYIEIMSKSIEHHKLTSSLVKSVEVTDYEADTSENASPLDRIFQIDCIYKVQPPEEQTR